jgi:biopolymer transport protein ExbD
MQFPSTLRLGIVAILIAIVFYAVPTAWIKTRNFDPLDVPLTLASGRFRSPKFKIDLSATYIVDFYEPAEAEPPYIFCGDQTSEIAKWRVFENGRDVPVNHEARSGLPSIGQFTGQHSDTFHGSPGIYSLDVELDLPPGCLKQAKVYLLVHTSQDKYWRTYFVLCPISLVLGVVGIAMLIQGVWSSIQSRSQVPRDSRALISQSPGYIRNFGLRKRRPMPLIHRMPEFGIFFTGAMLPTLAVFVIFTLHAVSRGFKIPLTRPGGIYVNVDPRTKPLAVWVDAKGNFFVNEEQVSRDGLPAALKRELSQRAESTVYFEADGDAYFGDAAFAMNEIKNASGKLVWLTPKTRADFAVQNPVK